MPESVKVVVTSRAFSQHPVLRQELLEKFANVKFNDKGEKFTTSTLIEYMRGFPNAIVSLETMDEEVLGALPDLKVISKYGVGLDNLDLEAMQKRKIRLGWKGGLNKRSVAELTLAHMISLFRHVRECNQDICEGIWKPRSGRQLSGKTIGLIGCGSIGKDLVELLVPFKCKILVHDIKAYPDFYEKYFVSPVGLDELLKRSDVISVHVPMNNSTRHLLNANRLALMKRNAILVNTARGGIVDEKALYEFLMAQKIAGAALDVFEIEPPTDLNLLKLPNVLATPHIGGSSEDAILAMGRAAILGLEAAQPVENILEEL